MTDVELRIAALYDTLYWQSPLLNKDLGKVEPPANFKLAGLVAYADGVNWNPNSQGAGFYRYDGAAWVKLLEPDDTFATSVDADKLDGHHWSEIPNVALTKYFESTEQTITSAGALTLAHGLGVEPKLVQLIGICKTAEANWSINDKTIFPIHSRYNNQDCVVWFDTTNIYIRFATTAGVFVHCNKTTGGEIILTNANWNVILRAWA